jgi:uncharacterized protein (TIGR00369 family)
MLSQMTGLEHMRAMVAGDAPEPPISKLLEFGAVRADPGEVVFTCVPSESVLNPLGLIHGGLVSTLLDSVIGCAIHTTLAAGVGFVSIDLNVSFLRPPVVGEMLTATGRVTKPGRRVAFGAGEVHDSRGKLIASGTGSCLVMTPT